MKTFRPGEVARAEDVNANFSEIDRKADAVAARLAATISAPNGQKAHQAIPSGATPVIKSIFHAGSTNQHGQIIIPIVGADLTGWHTALAIPTNFSNQQHDARCTVTGTHQSGPVLTFTNGQGHRLGNTGIGVTVLVVGWKA